MTTEDEDDPCDLVCHPPHGCCGGRARAEAELIELVNRLYALDERTSEGGPLHVALDDLNLDGVITPLYEYEYMGRQVPDDWSAEVHGVCDRIVALLNAMPEERRRAVVKRTAPWQS